MSTQDIAYAVEIDTGASAVTDTDYALVSGVLRFITGRPGYDGTLVPPYCPTDENSIAVTAQWFEGWLLPEELGSPSRQLTGIEATGGYGTMSGFDFAVHNATKLWSRLEALDVYLINRPVTLWVVIDNIFYYAWRGIVGGNPYSDAAQRVQCVDNFAVAHKPFPPTVISKTNFPDVSEDADGDVVPVCIGDVPYAGLKNVSAEPRWEVLSRVGGVDYYAVPADYYYLDYDNATGTISVGLKVTGDFPLWDTNYLSVMDGKYLFVARGGGSPDTDKAYLIIGTHYDKASGLLTVYLQDGFAADISVDAFTTSYAYKSAAATTSEDTWFFRIATLSTTGIISEKPVTNYPMGVAGPHLVEYDSNAKAYTDISNSVAAWTKGVAGTTYPSVTLTNTDLTKDGDIYAYTMYTARGVRVAPVATADLAGQPRAGYQYVKADDSWDENCTDPSTRLCNHLSYGAAGLQFMCPPRSSYYYSYHKACLRVDLPTIDWNSVQSLYIPIDWRTNDLGTYRITFDYRAVDFLGRHFSIIGDTAQFPGKHPPAMDDNVDDRVNGTFIPPAYFTLAGVPDTAPNRDFWKYELVGDGLTIKDCFLVPNEILQMIKDGYAVGSIDIILTFYTCYTYPTVKTFTFTELALVTSNKVSTSGSNNFVRVSGEKTGVQSTNNVWAAFKHILEDYDGISSSDIEYGNLLARRSHWHVGRQVTQRKNSADYLSELARNSFVVMFPTRKGRRRMNAWLDDNVASIAHDESVILAGTLKDLRPVDPRELYNDWSITYGVDPGRNGYLSGLVLTKVDQASFPASGTETWKTYMGGLDDDSYNDAKALWDVAHASYLRSQAMRQAPDQIQKLDWFVDVDDFDPDKTDTTLDQYRGTGGSAWKFLCTAMDWLSRQRAEVEYALPLTAANLTACELAVPVNFSDTLLTNGADTLGWIRAVTLDLRKHRIVIRLYLVPVDITYGLGDIEEIGDADTTIDENGVRADTIEEA